MTPLTTKNNSKHDSHIVEDLRNCNFPRRLENVGYKPPNFLQSIVHVDSRALALDSQLALMSA